MTPVTLNALHPEPAGWISPYLTRMPPGDYVVLCLFYQGNGFKFDDALADSLTGKKLVVLDMRELGWDKSHDDVAVAGACNLPLQMTLYPEFAEYDKLNAWVAAQKPITYFKREFSSVLQMRALPFPVHPIDLISFNRGPITTPNRDEFMARKGGIFYLYGNSHPDRLQLHGALQAVRNSASNSIGIAQQVIAKGYETDLLEQVHFAARYPLAQVLAAQGMFKASVALGGCGAKTFRHSEACVNSVPVIADIGMRYAVEWNDSNAIMLPTKNGRIDHQQACHIIGTALFDSERLWERMRMATATARMLEPDHYMENCVNKFILEAI